MSLNRIGSCWFLSLAAAAAAAPVRVSPTAVAAPTPGAASTAVARTVTVGSNPAAVAVARSLGQAFVVNDGSVSIICLRTHRPYRRHRHRRLPRAGRHRARPGWHPGLHHQRGADLDGRPGHRDPKGRQAHHCRTGGLRHGEGQHPVRATRPRQPLPRKHLTVVKTSNGAVAGQVKLPTAAQTSTGSPDGKSPTKTKRFIPITTLFEGEALKMGPLAFTGSGKAARVVNSTLPENPAAGQVAVLRASTGKVVDRVATGTEPTGRPVDTKRRTGYVPNFLDDTVTYFRTPR